MLLLVPFLQLAHREGTLSRDMPDGNAVQPKKAASSWTSSALRVAVLWLGLGPGALSTTTTNPK